jgi:hypothetical protein
MAGIMRGLANADTEDVERRMKDTKVFVRAMVGSDGRDFRNGYNDLCSIFGEQGIIFLGPVDVNLDWNG